MIKKANIKGISKYLVIIVIACFACGKKLKDEQNSSIKDSGKIKQNKPCNDYTITKATVEDFEKASKNYSDNILYDTLQYQKQNGKIRLPLFNKKQVILTDTLVGTDDTDIREYKYEGQFKNIGYYFVSGLFWEFEEGYLIDKSTGAKTAIWTKPIISPNGKCIASLSMPYGLEGTPNGFQIWQVLEDANTSNNSKLKKCIELNQEVWIPINLFWETDYSFIIEVMSIDRYISKEDKTNLDGTYYLRITMK